MKKILLILIIFITGCKNYTDLTDLTIIKSIGIKYDNTYNIYAQIYDEIKSEREPKTKLIDSKGKTVEEAINNLKKLVNKEIFLSHIDLLILDINLKDVNYNEIIDFFIYNNELRNDFLTIISDDIKTLLNNTKYDEIEYFIKTNNTIRNIIEISFEELANNYLENKSFIITKINYNGLLNYENYYCNNHNFERIDNEKDRT